jgi:6-pyruvoyltetrahydropterin/6-carboxytetrahydropterin synthase
MKYELTQRFFFESAHTLQRSIDAEPSRRYHGHTYVAEVSVGGNPDGASGMVVDLGYFRQAIERVRLQLDHRLLDEVPGLGPATLENLCGFIFRALAEGGVTVSQVVVKREASGDSCRLSA